MFYHRWYIPLVSGGIYYLWFYWWCLVYTARVIILMNHIQQLSWEQSHSSISMMSNQLPGLSMRSLERELHYCVVARRLVR